MTLQFASHLVHNLPTLTIHLINHVPSLLLIWFIMSRIPINLNKHIYTSSTFCLVVSNQPHLLSASWLTEHLSPRNWNCGWQFQTHPHTSSVLLLVLTNMSTHFVYLVVGNYKLIHTPIQQCLQLLMLTTNTSAHLIINVITDYCSSTPIVVIVVSNLKHIICILISNVFNAYKHIHTPHRP